MHTVTVYSHSQYVLHVCKTAAFYCSIVVILQGRIINEAISNYIEDSLQISATMLYACWTHCLWQQCWPYRVCRPFCSMTSPKASAMWVPVCDSENDLNASKRDSGTPLSKVSTVTPRNKCIRLSVQNVSSQWQVWGFADKRFHFLLVRDNHLGKNGIGNGMSDRKNIFRIKVRQASSESRLDS